MIAVHFDWPQLNDLVQRALDRSVVDDSLRWFAIGNAPSVGVALLFARRLVPTYCTRAFVGNSDAGIAVWIDVLSWKLDETDA